MATLHFYEIYTEDPAAQPPALIALADLRRQRWNQEIGKKLRALTKVINERIAEVGEERKRLLAVHAKVGTDGDPIEVKVWTDLKDRMAFQADFQEFLEETFEVPGLPQLAVEGRDLLGETWVSPLLEDAPVEKKEAAPTADGGGGSSGSGAADN